MKYFAYGSNMSSEQIAQRCPDHQFLGVALLSDYRLAFLRRSQRGTKAGVADITPFSGRCVWGVVFEVSDSDLGPLDKSEAVGKAYDRTTVEVLVAETTKLSCMTYTVIKKELHEICPDPEYLNKLIDGAEYYKLPSHYVSYLKSLRNVTVEQFHNGVVPINTY